MTGSQRTRQSLKYRFRKTFDENISEAEEKLSDLDVLSGMVDFRDDLEDIYVNERQEDLGWSDKRQLVKTAKFGLSDQTIRLRRIQKGLEIWDKAQLIQSIATLFISVHILSYIGLSNFQANLGSAILAVVVYFIDFGLPFTKAMMNNIGYRTIPVRAKDESVKFRAGWNRGVLDSPVCFIGVLLIGLLSLRGSRAYNIALKFLRWYLRSKENLRDYSIIRTLTAYFFN